MKPIPRSVYVLSIISLACAAAASAITIAWSGAYPQPAPPLPSNTILAEARGWGAATLVIAVPLAAIAMWAARRGSISGRLAWLGALAYLVYTYLELAVSGPFTPLYLPYIAAFATALAAIVLFVGTIDVAALPQQLGARAPRKLVAFYSTAVAIFLSLAWLKPILERTAAGDFGWNDPLGSIGHVVHALDLGLIVPLALLSAVLLLRKKPSGDLAGAMMLVLGACMGGALAAMVAWSSAVAGGDMSACVPFVALFAASAALAAWFLLYAPAIRAR